VPEHPGGHRRMQLTDLLTPACVQVSTRPWLLPTLDHMADVRKGPTRESGSLAGSTARRRAQSPPLPACSSRGEVDSRFMMASQPRRRRDRGRRRTPL
jgi:hypothetical protein